MPLLTENGVIDDYALHCLKDDQIISDPQYQLISLQRWQNQPDDDRCAGFYLNGDEAVEQILQNAPACPLIGLRFSTAADGRCFSLARLLRRAGYSGDLVAMGHVVADHSNYLRRCGIKTIQYPTAETCLAGKSVLQPFSVSYQTGPHVL